MITAPTRALTASPAATPPLWRLLAPICLLVFGEFLAMGLPLPVLPLRVHDQLGFGSFAVGIVIGAQSWLTLLTRHASGTRSDERGPRHAAWLGLVLSALAGALSYLSSLLAAPLVSLTVLLVARGVLGLGESLVVTAALAWGVTLAGRERSGIVMAWVGIAMYGAMAAGAPLGSLLDAQLGFAGVSLAAALAPLLGGLALPFAQPVAPAGGTRLPFQRLGRLIWLPGAGLALCALGFGAIAAFSTHHFAARGFSHAALAMSAFGAAYVLARLLFGKLPDRLGGARVAIASAALTALGQLGLWLAPSSALAVAAAACTGFGFSLAFPAFGVEAIRRVPPQHRGVALGAYAAFFDAAMGLGVPALGVMAGSFGHGAVFGIGALGALAALVIASVLAVRSEPRSPRA